MTGEKRTAEETLELFRQGLKKRRDYLRRRLAVIDQVEKKEQEKRGNKRGRKPAGYAHTKALREGTISIYMLHYIV